jgi:hypothetical protein
VYDPCHLAVLRRNLLPSAAHGRGPTAVPRASPARRCGGRHGRRDIDEMPAPSAQKRSVERTWARGRLEGKAVPGDPAMRTSLGAEPARAITSATFLQEARGRHSAAAARRRQGAQAAASPSVRSARSVPAGGVARALGRRVRPVWTVGRPRRRGRPARALGAAGAAALAEGPAAGLQEPWGESVNDEHGAPPPALSRPGRVEYDHMRPLGRPNPSAGLDGRRAPTDVSRRELGRRGQTWRASIDSEARPAGLACWRSSTTHRIRRKPRRSAANWPARPCARRRLGPAGMAPGRLGRIGASSARALVDPRQLAAPKSVRALINLVIKIVKACSFF